MKNSTGQAVTGQQQIRENKIKCQKNIIICESKLWASQAM